MWSSSIAFAIDLLGILNFFFKQQNICFSFIWFHSICWFLFYLNSAWRRIAADTKVKVKRALRLRGIVEAGGDENDQLGHNQELVTKRRTTSVAWSCVFKHCSFKTTDFKPLKIKQQSYMCAPSLSVWEACALSFLPTLYNYINTLICVRIPIFASILKHSDLGLKREKTQCNRVIDPDFGLKGEAVQYSFCLPFMLIITHC